MIAVKPKPWTRHHTNRLYHLSMTMCFAAAAVVAILTSASAFIHARAGQTDITASVMAVNSGPTTIVSSGGTGAPAAQPQQPKPAVGDQPVSPKVDLEIAPEQLPRAIQEFLKRYSDPIFIPKRETVNVAGKSMSVPVYYTQLPDFWGKTNISNANIYLEVHSEQVIRVTTTADREGYWVWHSTEPITPGAHTLIVVAEHPEYPEIRTRSEKIFVVRTQNPPGPPRTTEPLVEAPGNSGVLFDVFIKIQKASKQIPAGEEIVASLKLINFGAAGHPVDVPVEYTIEDDKGQVIMRIKETIAVATQISILKSFYTSPTLAQGTYTLIARAPTKDAIAVALDTFEVKGEPVIALSEETRVNFTIVFQTLLALFFLFVIITYFEYNKVVALSGVIKRVSEADLKSN